MVKPGLQFVSSVTTIRYRETKGEQEEVRYIWMQILVRSSALRASSPAPTTGVGEWSAWCSKRMMMRHSSAPSSSELTPRTTWPLPHCRGIEADYPRLHLAAAVGWAKHVQGCQGTLVEKLKLGNERRQLEDKPGCRGHALQDMQERPGAGCLVQWLFCGQYR